MPNKPPRHSEDIKAALRKEFGTLEAFAELVGLPGGTIRSALSRRTPRGNRAIAKALGYQLHQIWPHWFDEDGNSITRPNATRPRAESKRTKGRSAADLVDAA